MQAKLIFELVFGLLITSRTIHLLRSGNIIAVEQQKYLRWMYLITPLVLLFLSTIDALNLFWWISVLFFAAPYLSAIIIERRRARQFVSETLEFYDELVFELRSGNSLRSSLDRINNGSQFGFYTREMVGVALKGSESKSAISNKLTDKRVLELRRLLHASGKILERLQFLRRLHHLEEKFRRKSRVATRQVRAQAMIVVLFYFGLLFLEISAGLVKPFSLFVGASAVLLMMGLLVFHLLMRSFKWKV